jgi:Nitrogenase molybdenum-iron protein, alpha and beta chains
MKKLLKYLSPFAPDQSGACGVLYELGGLIVICDAGGCAGNICGFDEPRWFTKKSAVFSAGLRDMDAIMGRDDKLITKLADAQDTLQCKFTAIVATPVPAVIGTDMKALKRMAEKKTGVPCITVNAIGTRYYDEGESEAWEKLFREFTASSVESVEREAGKKTDGEFIGIIGATPLETGYSTSEPLMEGLQRYGIDNPILYSMGTGLDEIREASYAKENLVVSAAGLKAAEYLEEQFGVPYKVGYPFIPSNVADKVREILQKEGDSIKNILIIHSQFAANELRKIIRSSAQTESILYHIDCATFFMQSDKYTEESDIRLSGEDELWEIVSDNRYDLIIADEDIKRLLDAAGYRGQFAAFPQYAISGRPLDEGKTLYDLNYND